MTAQSQPIIVLKNHMIKFVITHITVFQENNVPLYQNLRLKVNWTDCLAFMRALHVSCVPLRTFLRPSCTFCG